MCNLLLDYENKIRGHFIHFWFKKKKLHNKKQTTKKKCKIKFTKSFRSVHYFANCCTVERAGCLCGLPS